MITVIKKGKTPVYEVECYECGSVLHYNRVDVSLMHIPCPICGVSNSVTYKEVEASTEGEETK